jgi:hypothetical protein
LDLERRGKLIGELTRDGAMGAGHRNAASWEVVVHLDLLAVGPGIVRLVTGREGPSAALALEDVLEKTHLGRG